MHLEYSSNAVDISLTNLYRERLHLYTLFYEMLTRGIFAIVLNV